MTQKSKIVIKKWIFHKGESATFTDFESEIEIAKNQNRPKNSWKFVYSIAKQHRSIFYLTNFRDKNPILRFLIKQWKLEF